MSTMKVEDVTTFSARRRRRGSPPVWLLAEGPDAAIQAVIQAILGAYGSTPVPWRRLVVAAADAIAGPRAAEGGLCALKRGGCRRRKET